MLETLDLDKKLSKAAYDKSFRPLRDKLRELQQRCYEAKVPVLVVFEGWDAAGKGDSIEKVVGRLDPRGYKVHPTYAPLEEERLRPFLWRFWTKIPARGEIAIFDQSWYRRVLADRVEKDVSREDVDLAWVEINQFERMLADDGTAIVKFWLHISAKEQKKRFERLEKSRYERWRVTRREWQAHKRYAKYLAAAEAMLERTGTTHAPWTVVEATDRHYRRVMVFKALADAMQRALDRRTHEADDAKREGYTHAARPSVAVPALREVESVLDKVDLTRKLSEKKYGLELEKYQARLHELQFACFRARVPVVITYEGSDAAGKGGNIRRVIGPLDPRGYDVIPIAAPKGDDATHHYLWRFWNRVPKAGHFAIFDRTWYGRVLVERVEGFCTDDAWRRAYQEINEFERSLANFGTVIVKFWLQVSKDEQLRRFEEREHTDYKKYKITDEDWRNREKWDQYRQAVVDMLAHTSTSYAPWTIVEANDKLWARIKTMRTIVQAIEAQLGRAAQRKNGKQR